MNLPEIKHPTFDIVLPSTGQTIVFRPFLVKEEKILLIAQSSGEQSDIIRAIKQIIQNCILTEDINVNDFTTYDLEYFFIKLRARSVNNVIKLSYRDREDNHVYDIEVNLDEINVHYPEHVDNNIQVNDQISIKMRYPRISIVDSAKDIDDPVAFNFLIMQSCIDAIVDGSGTYTSDVLTQEYLENFIDSLDIVTYNKIQSFVDAMPKVEHTISYTNSNGKEVKIVLNSLNDFFSLG